MAAPSEADVAAQLIERLLGDPRFRAEFRRDPASACRAAGLDGLADEMALGAGKAMLTLDVRESKSSLAGVMMAAAMEGVGVYQFGEHVLPHIDDVPDAVSDVLSRVNLPAIGARGALAAQPAEGAAAAAEPAGDGAAPSAPGGGGAAGAAAANGAAAPEQAAAAKDAAAPMLPPEQAAAAKDAAAPVLPPEQAAAGKDAAAPVLPPEQAAAAKIAAAESPEAQRAAASQDAAAKIAEEAEDVPSASSLPDSGVAPQSVEETGKGAGTTPEPAPAAPEAAPAAAAAPQPAASGEPIDPGQFGGEGTGTGGPPDAEALALLANDNVVLDSVGIADIKAGRIDPRVVAVLTKLSQEHEIKVSCMCSDHSKLTSGGSISNHFYGRGLDIASIDGEIVNPDSVAAREIAMELQDLDPAYRPNEIGTPWAISGPGYFTDAGHQDHLHVGFKQEITPDWTPPADVAAGSTPAAAAPMAAAGAVPASVAAAAAGEVPAAGAPAAAGAAGAAAPKAGDSLAFRAVTAEDSAAAKKSDSLAFMAVKGPAGPASTLAPAEAVPAGVADAAAATATGASSLGASALEVAQGELARGVREEGTNTGLDVDKYLKEAGVAPGNPWCASFVTWALAQNGHKMEGGGWAAVQTWVRSAEAGTNDLQVVSADEARPGDIVAYDWGGQEDFGADGHIGFLESTVEDGKFTALEGNYQDAVLRVPRQMGDANVKFLRIGGDAPTPAASAAPAAPAPPAPLAASAPPVAPADPGAVADSVTAAAGSGGGAKATAAIEEAKKYLGTDYVWGGSTPETGFDCSGLVQWAYAQAGIKLPRVTYDQIDVGEKVEMNALAPGDLVYFGEPEPWHVGIALGDGKFLHAPKTGDVVKVTELEGYWESEFAGARRVDTSAAAPSGGDAPPAAPAAAAAVPAAAVDPAAVAEAQAAVARDAAEVRRGDSMLFMAVQAQEAHKQRVTVQFMKAIDPKQAQPVAAAPGAAAPGASDASMVQAVGAPVPAAELSVADVGPLGDYPGDNASQAELAKWLAAEAEKAGLPPELPVMASLVESGVKNLKGGDADSAGFFQMRVGIWDQGEYAGYRDDPRLQAKWFIDNALAVKEQRLAAGRPIDDPSQYGEWIADVERPAAEYRGRYQPRLGEARRLLS